MNANIKPSNRGVLVGVIDPDAYAPGTLTSGWISLADFGAIQAIISWGDLSTLDTINAKLQQATDSSGTGPQDVAGKLIVAIDSSASPIPHNKQAVINCRADELDVADSYTHVRLSITLASTSSPLGTADIGAVLLGYDARYQPAADATSVAQVIG
jgi:hypothetical protein